MGNLFALCVTRPQTNDKTENDSNTLLHESVPASFNESNNHSNNHKLNRIYTIQKDFNTSGKDKQVEKDLEKRFGF